MKNTILPLFGLFIANFVLGEFEVPHLIVYGTAETRVVPDEMNWSLSVKTLGQDVGKLAEQHLDEVAVVLQYLMEAGIEDKYVKTSRMQLTENWVYRDRSRLQEGYFAFTSVTFKTAGYADYVDHWKALSKFKNLTINGVQFGISNRIEIRNQTRLDAIAAARKKAADMAEAMGTVLAEPLLVEELDMGIDYSAQRGNAVFSLESAPQSDTAVSPGQETISARLKVVYRITCK